MNIILLSLLFIITFGSLWMNHRTTTTNSQISLINNDIETNIQYLKKQQTEVTHLSGKRKQDLEKVISELKKDTEIKKNIVSVLESKQWSTAYNLLAEENLKILEYEKKGQTANSSEEFIDAIKRELLIFRYLSSHNMQYEPTDFSTKGVNFFAWVSNNIIPYFFVLVSAFILTNFYLISYRSNGIIDTDSLIPGKNITKQFVKISVGIIFSLISVLCLFLVSFISATFLFGSGNLDYPYIVYTSKYNMHVEPLENLLLKSLPLQLLSLISTCLLFYIIAILVKNKLGALFVSLLLSTGVLFGISTLDPIQKISSFIPITYINSFSIVTGTLARQIENFQLSLTTGYLVVTSSIVLLSIAVIILNRFRGDR